jgi:hypothetical protein
MVLQLAAFLFPLVAGFSLAGLGWRVVSLGNYALVDTFAETAFVDYCLSFADQGIQTSVSVCNEQMEVCCFRFPLQQTNGSCRFLLVPFPLTVT